MQPFSVLIVDDEPMIRQGLQDAVAWAELGFRVAGTAEDGLEAVEQYRRLRPNLVLMDIKMPGMDGLQALEQIKAEDGAAEVILLSGYDEFAYAKRGMQIGAFDYVLKINVFDELESTLQRLYGKLAAGEAREARNRQADRLRTHYQFDEWLQGRAPDDWLAGALISSCLAVSIWQQPPGAHQRWDLADEGTTACVREDGPYTHVLFLSKGLRGPQLRERVLTVLRQREAASFDGRGELLMAVGDWKPSVAELPASYREARKGIDFLRSGGRRRGLLDLAQWRAEAGLKAPGIVAEEDKSDWRDWVYSGDADKLLPWLTEWFAKACAAPDISLRDMQGRVMELFAQFHRLLRDSGLHAEWQTEELARFDSLIELREFAVQQTRQWCGQLQEGLRQERNRSLLLVQHYIDDFYASDLSMEQVARTFHFSPSHLSAKFKEWTGVPFSTYLINRRLEAACELLAGSAMRVQEIAERVGYQDEKHFSKIFSRYKQLSPREYRNCVRAGELTQRG